MSSGWWFRFGKSLLILLISDFVLFPYLCFGIGNFCFEGPGSELSSSDEISRSSSVDEQEELESIGLSSFLECFFGPVNRKKWRFVVWR